MAKISIDGIDYDVPEGENLLQSVLSKHLDLPYFCWHPSLGSIGACRQCAVVMYADENDQRGRLMMACMTGVSDGMRISLKAPKAESFRATVIEWLMENHPHDCPVCEEGGECHLQDMTVMTGHSQRRYQGAKRTWRNQDLGPFIGHEMNRCITCYRCVRFYDEYAGGTDLAALGSRDRMFFGRVEDGTLENEFAGNLVEVCPTGVFTDKPFAQSYTRKWDLQTAPSICTSCSIGCNIFPAERYGQFKRITNRYHGELNGYFLCDRGRFGSHFVNHDQRIRHVGVRQEDGSYGFGATEQAIAKAADLLNDRTIGIGSPRASFENNYALKELVGASNFCIGVNDRELEILNTIVQIYQTSDVHVATINEVEQADAIFILGEDIANSAPRVALAVRQATRLQSFDLAQDAAIPTWQDAGVRGHAQHTKNPLLIATPAATRLDEIAQTTISGSTQELIELGAAVESNISNQISDSLDPAVQVAKVLMTASRPLVVAGGGLNEVGLVIEAAKIVRKLRSHGKQSSILLVPPEVNSLGVALLDGELKLSEALERIATGDTAVILENDLYRRLPREDVDAVLSRGNTLVLDSLENQTTEHATIVFPAATYVEQTGTMVNYETRAQRFFQVFEPKDEVSPSWQWLAKIAGISYRKASFETYRDLLAQCAQQTFGALLQIAPDADYRIGGSLKIPRQTHRYSGRTAMTADENIHEPKSTVDHDTPLSYSMEGLNSEMQNGATIPYTWSPGWNSNQSVFKFQQEVGGELIGGDPGIRLVQANGDAFQELFSGTAQDFQSDQGLEAVPIQLVFGSDELSNQSWPIRARLETPFVLLSEADAVARNLTAGMGVKVTGVDLSFEVRLDPRLRTGVVGIPTGIVENSAAIPRFIEIQHDPDFERASTSTNVIATG